MSTPRRPRTTTAPTAAQKKLAAERSAAARARIADAQRRRRLWTVGGSVGVVVVILVALVLVKVFAGGGTPASGVKATAAGSVAAKIADVPVSALNAAGAGSGTTPPKALTGDLLTSGGKPRVLFIGGEFCPYCAAERWPLAVALSRFGTLHNLGQTSSSPSDVYPSTPTLTFHGATYTSTYLTFTGKEAQSNQVSGSSYTALDPIDSADQALWKQIGGDGYPFLDIGGRWASLRASYSPQLLHGMTQAEVAAALSDPTSKVGQTILGSANEFTAAICTLTDNRPAAVCASAGVKTAAAKLPSGS